MIGIYVVKLLKGTNTKSFFLIVVSGGKDPTVFGLYFKQALIAQQTQSRIVAPSVLDG